MQRQEIPVVFTEVLRDFSILLKILMFFFGNPY